MKFYHTTKNEESARDIVANGADSKKSTQQQKGGFYLWTDLKRALKYTDDDYISGEGSPHVLVFDLDFNTNDFDIDYEGSGQAIAKWAFDNKDLIAQKTGTTIEILTPPGGLSRLSRRKTTVEIAACRWRQTLFTGTRRSTSNV